METITSFAPLAARLAARAAELRPVDGSRDTLAKFVALVVCGLLDVLIYVCGTLDARAEAGIRPVAALVPCTNTVVAVLAPRVGRQAPPAARRARLPSLAPQVQAVAPNLATLPSVTDAAIQAGPWLAWSRDASPIRAGSRFPTAATLKNAALQPAPTHVHFVTIS